MKRFEEFRELVLSDESLQHKLRDLTDRRDFINSVITIAEEHGYQFTPADLEEEIRNRRRIWIERWI